jgi:5'-3' exonuclease
MTIAIIDGDVLCYLACKERWKEKAKIENGISYISLDDSGKRKPLEWTKEEDQKFLQKTWIILQKDLKTLLEEVYCNDYIMAVKGDNNYRNMMYPDYKINRHKDPNKQNIFVPVLRKLLVMEDYAVQADGFEADDLIRIWAEQCRLHGIDYIICSIDKDLRCIPGKHWGMKKKELVVVSEEEAMRHYYYQLLKGDSTDNIPGVPGIGEKTANRLLALLSTEEEYQECVVEQYMLAYGDNWEDWLLFNGKMIHLMKDPNDYFTLKDWPVARALREMKKENKENIVETK